MNYDKYIRMLIMKKNARITHIMYLNDEKEVRNSFIINIPGEEPIKCYSKRDVLIKMMGEQ